MNIDFVIAWVDGGDPQWRREKAQYDPTVNLSLDAREARFRDWENLQYWFRAVEKYAPWVHKIYFVTWGHLPPFLNTDNEKLVVVNHKDFIPEQYLPTFNANTIELNLHRIEGLSEHFVYFNDDMFLTRPVTAEDFFQNGLPRDEFAFDAVLFTPDSIGHLIANDLELVNKHFGKRQQMKKLRLPQYLNFSYGLINFYRTLVLMAWPWYTGFYCSHIPAGFLKSTLEEVWALEPKVMGESCEDRFRSKRNLNQYVFKFWQLVQGKFVPRSTKFGKAFHLSGGVNQQLLDAIENQRYSMICINDTPNITDFAEHKRRVQQAFEKILPEKSSFEK